MPILFLILFNIEYTYIHICRLIFSYNDFNKN